jgi:AcrR family transcriptional regulator
VARTRSQAAHQKVIEAAISLFAERGLDATSMDTIAEVSGVSKATIYKHWPNKDALCLEALSYLVGSDIKVPVPDTGDLRADLIARLSYQPAPDRALLRERIMPHVLAYASRNPEFGRAWRARAMSPVITALQEWIQREQQRGTLVPTIDVESAISLLMGPLLYRNIFHKREPGGQVQFAPHLERHIAEAFLALYALPRR